MASATDWLCLAVSAAKPRPFSAEWGDEHPGRGHLAQPRRLGPPDGLAQPYQRGSLVGADAGLFRDDLLRYLERREPELDGDHPLPGRVLEVLEDALTGASRGLGLASAAHLYQQGWEVVGAMRTPEAGLERLRDATGATDDDPRLIGVQLDLTEPASITAAAKTIDAIGPPDSLVHNAAITAVGCTEELEPDVWHQLFTTNLFGPVELTNALLPAMRAAGRAGSSSSPAKPASAACRPSPPTPPPKAPPNAGPKPSPTRSHPSGSASRS